MKIASLNGIEQFEATPLVERDLSRSTYEMIPRGAARAPQDPATAAVPAPPSPATHKRVHDFHVLIAQQPSDRLLSGRDIRPGDIGSNFCTGGTTGLPKIAIRTYGNKVFNAHTMGLAFDGCIDATKTLLCGLPLFHVNAVLMTGLLLWSLGAHVLPAKPHGYRGAAVLQGVWEIVEHHALNVVRSTIKSADRRIDVGEQLLPITWPQTPTNQGHDRLAVAHISGGTS
jgi:acyl-CoA synthetase (AMP-forming)/AMP-acid ligase II